MTTGFTPQPPTVAEAETSSIEAIHEIAPELLALPPDEAGSDDTRALLPLDPNDGITVHTGSGTATIGIPEADTAHDARLIADGVLEYDTDDGYSSVPLVKDDGQMKIATVIESAAAPDRYAYELGLPVGSTLEKNEDGSVSALDAEGELTALVNVPWAEDADGASVPTHFEIEGTTLVQIVEHRGASYPVVADPWWIPALRLVGFFSKHALQQIAERNIRENLVRIALQEGTRTAGKDKGTSVFSANNIRVVVNDKTGKIITVTKPGGGGGGGGV
ncbi:MULTISPECIES: DUF4258 domain-containing protein [unclassified Rathayibacter]|uniref:DUF4258 domain-containing protein n=1 Tax=unclassified Rathayibacter TaxID=2609250 RepID=UPI001404CE0C|nr:MULTISPECIES: DUF4258 domain-containing protein [unclassified Rathayibacter]